MTSVSCPKCKKHMSVFEVACFHCGCIMTDEERDRQLEEQEKQRQEDELRERSPKPEALKHPREHKMSRKINTISFDFFKLGWDELVVPLIIVLLIMIVAMIMFL